MLQINVFEDHVKEYDQWYEEHQAIFQSEVFAIKDQMLKLGPNIHGVEIGLGTGRFSDILGIKEGIEPSTSMSDKAIKRGIEVMNAKAENLPYKSLSYDFVLFVTVCHLENVKVAFKEANRILKRGGSIIVGFLKASGEAAKSYEEKRSFSTFYKNAQFYKVETLERYLSFAGFDDFDYTQTLFGKLEDIDEIQPTKPGYDIGSFVVVKAQKR